MLPESLLCLLSASLAFAQSRTPLQNGVTALNTARLQSPSFSITQNTHVEITVALCADASPAPRFFLSNVDPSNPQAQPVLSDSLDTWEITLRDGLGFWTGLFPDGGILTVDTNGITGGVPFEVGLSDSDLIHGVLSTLPLFGDTTSNQALLFSAPFLRTPDDPPPTYPNYTLPAANLSQPTLPAASASPNITLILSPTSVGLGLTSANHPRTGCFLSSQNSTGTIAVQTPWARGDGAGWRMQWVVEGLTPSTNYTAFVVHNQTKVSGPIFFATKSAAFPCPLVHSLPYCPSVAYAVPLAQPSSSSTNTNGSGSTYDGLTLPAPVSTPLLSFLANFTTVLTTFACGRDWYSPLMGCNDCQREYRAWLCSVSFTRCSEPSPANPNGFTAVPAGPSATGGAASAISSLPGSGAGSPQQPIILSALLPIPTRSPLPARSLIIPAASSSSPFALSAPYTALLPCLEQCHRVDRACPPFIGFKCPSADFNAGASYGIGYIDSADGGKESKNRGLTGTGADEWGNVWCGMA